MAMQSIPPLPPQAAAARASVTSPRPASPDSVSTPAPLTATLNVVKPEQEADSTRSTAQPSREQLDQAMQQMQQALPPVARNLQFSIDEETGRTVVKVIDPSTKEVIRQMPSEELLSIAKALDSMRGLLIKQDV